MSSDKVKIYKNPDRKNTVEHEPYVPQYRIMGIEPTKCNDFTSNTTNKVDNVPIVKSAEIIISKSQKPMPSNHFKTSTNQPYAETFFSPIGKEKGLLPNVGNNMEHTWSNIDDENIIIDDVFNDENKSMIDNNDYVTDAALGLSSDKKVNSYIKEEIANDLKALNDNELILLIDNVVICSGDINYIESQVSSLVFGEHELCNGSPILLEDLVVLKKVKIKAGIFLE